MKEELWIDNHAYSNSRLAKEINWSLLSEDTDIIEISAVL